MIQVWKLDPEALREAAAEAKVPKCRHCGAQDLLRKTRTVTGTQLYRCRACGRGTTRWEPEGRADVRYPFLVNLMLDVPATLGLAHYRKRHGLAADAEAIRRVFRAAVPPGPETEAAPLVLAHVTGHANVMRARDTGTRDLPSVYIERRLTVCLDEAALRGLAAYKLREGMTHQEAARWLLSWEDPSFREYERRKASYPPCPLP